MGPERVREMLGRVDVEDFELALMVAREKWPPGVGECLHLSSGEPGELWDGVYPWQRPNRRNIKRWGDRDTRDRRNKVNQGVHRGLGRAEMARRYGAPPEEINALVNSVIQGSRRGPGRPRCKHG